ncbi:DUF4145 domain-containing protein [uncultured Helicobacter sp.]|uniref:DUF4145 domain-containing protein n=1 Tax=uncultured Helicobacter sp. TaxID=175537 RepID=UPI00260798DD|nr:DUF4145 domain-containing protein [uncultured Helicobacter sp.]
MKDETSPRFREDAFVCPYCKIYSQIEWHEDKALEIDNPYTEELAKGYCFAQCKQCGGVMCFAYQLNSVYQDEWGNYREEFDDTMIFPSQQNIVPPLDNMPKHIKDIYNEASAVFSTSPRASCALLRLALQELMIFLKENFEEYHDLKGKKIDSDIETLVKNHRLDSKIQKALDIVRITGNNAVHPNELDINDSPDIAQQLFKMINFIVEEMVTKNNEKEIEELYAKMPQKAIEWIKERDS